MTNYPLIVIDAIDGAGKKTHTTRLVEDINKLGLSAIRFDFPNYSSLTGKAIESHLHSKWKTRFAPGVEEDPLLDELIFQVLMTVNRFEDVEKIECALEKGPVVLDRYWPSGYAYGGANGLSLEWLKRVHSLLPEPDCCILLDIPVEASWGRRPLRRDRYEDQKDLLEKAKHHYLELFNQNKDKSWRTISVDIDETEDSVHRKIQDIVYQCTSINLFSSLTNRDENTVHDARFVT